MPADDRAGRGFASGLRRRRAMLRRVLTRQVRHVARAGHAARMIGPGRLAGMVLGAEAAEGDIVVWGWAHLPPPETVESVVVTVDEVPVGVATVGLPTPLVPGLGPATPRSPSSGWSVRIPRSQVPVAARQYGAIAVLRSGFTEQLVPFPDGPALRVAQSGLTAAARRLPPGRLEGPAAGTVFATATVTAWGWMLAESGYDRVEVQLGDGLARRARLFAEPRPELTHWTSAPSAPMAGWHVVLDVPPVDTETAMTLRATALGGRGGVELGRADLVFQPVEPCVVAPDVPILAARADAVAARHRPTKHGLNLLVVTHHLGLGGAQLYLQELLRQLLQPTDVTCTVVSPVDGELRAQLEEWGARVHIVPRFTLDASHYEARMLDLAAIAGTTGANIVLANAADSFWGVDLAARCCIPAIWAIHESFTVDQFVSVALGVTQSPGYIRQRLVDALASAAAIVFVADATLQQYVDHGDADRFVRIDYGIDLTDIERHRATADRSGLRRRHGLHDDQVLLVCMGTFEPRKAQAALLLAFARVAARFPEAVLALVGDAGTHFAQGVHVVAERLGLGARVRLLPVTRDVETWYLMGDALVSASDIESLPRTMLEAMAFGLPVLGTAVFGVPELIEDGRTGFLCEPLSLDGLASGLERMLALTPDARRELGERGRDLVLRTRSSEFYANSIRGLLDALVVDPRALPKRVLRA